MVRFVLLSTLTSEGGQRLHADPDRLLQVNEELEELGCKVVDQYATLGPYDFVTIVDAPDNEAAAVLSAGLSSRGTVKILTMPAMPAVDFLGRLKSAGNLGRS